MKNNTNNNTCTKTALQPCLKATIQPDTITPDFLCPRMGEPDLRLIINWMALWDLPPRQLAGIIVAFNGLKANEKKALVEYSKAVLKLHEEGTEAQKPISSEGKIRTYLLCPRM